MSAARLTLEYELTRDDMQAAFERMRLKIRPAWISRIGACLALWVAIDGWDRHQ